MPHRSHQDKARRKIGRRGLITEGAMAACLAWALAPLRRARAAAGLTSAAAPPLATSSALASDISSDYNLLLVAGPATGRLAQWANLLCPLIGPGLGNGGSLHWNAVGAADGVTAANQFDARVSPDGSTAMLLPGAAATAQLPGDPRAQFDAGSWVAGLAGVSSTVVMGRVPLAELPTNAPLLVLADEPGGADLPILLGLSLLGYDVKPINSQNTLGDPRAALAGGQINIASITGSAVRDVAVWQDAGLVPLFSLGSIDTDGGIGADPMFPALPSLQNLLLAKGVSPLRPLPTAWRALCAAKQLTLGLVLPQLTPASRVAQWRQACTDGINSLTIQAIAATESLRFLSPPLPVATIAALTAPAGAQLELHQWLDNRLGWRPS